MTDVSGRSLTCSLLTSHDQLGSPGTSVDLKEPSWKRVGPPSGDLKPYRVDPCGAESSSKKDTRVSVDMKTNQTLLNSLLRFVSLKTKLC